MTIIGRKIPAGNKAAIQAIILMLKLKGYSLVKNLFIKTGFRRAAFKFVQDFETILFYDGGKEYDRPGEASAMILE